LQSFARLDGEDFAARPLTLRKQRLATMLPADGSPLHYSDHIVGQGPAFYDKACAMRVEGIVSKRIDAPYAPGNRGLWRKVKCLNRAEFVVIGWTDPEGRRPWLGALLLGYYTPDGRLIYAGRVGTGTNDAELERLWRRLQPLATDKMPLMSPRRGRPALVRRWCSRGCIAEVVVEVKYLTWTDDGLLRQVVYEGIREDKPAREVVRQLPPS
jgi:bifunctional non-homologous end joining protein LigD